MDTHRRGDPWGLQPLGTAFEDDHCPDPAEEHKPPYGRPEQALEAIAKVVDRFEQLYPTRRAERVKLLGGYIEVFGQGAICRAPADEDLRPTIIKLLGIWREANDLRLNNPIQLNGDYCRINEHYRRIYPKYV